MWYRLAAEHGHVDAQYNLSEMYVIGRGVTQDYAMAHMWGNIAAANGVEKGAKLRDNLAGEMTQTDIAAAQRMARECMASNYENCGY